MAAALRLAQAEHPVLPPAALARIEAQVLAAARQMPPVPVGPVIPRSGLGMLARFVLLVVALGAVLGMGLYAAVAGGFPGDALYSFKGVVEQVELDAASGPQAAAGTHPAPARRRMDEGSRLLERRSFDLGLVSDVLGDLADAARVARAANLDSAILAPLIGRTIDTLSSLQDGGRYCGGAWASFRRRTSWRPSSAIQTVIDSGDLLLPPRPLSDFHPHSDGHAQRDTHRRPRRPHLHRP